MAKGIEINYSITLQSPPAKPAGVTLLTVIHSRPPCASLRFAAQLPEHVFEKWLLPDHKPRGPQGAHSRRYGCCDFPTAARRIPRTIKRFGVRREWVVCRR